MAHAHHGFGTFVMNEDIEMTGVITDLNFVNPHAWLYLDVMLEDGQVAAYRCEMRSANTLRRSGWSPDLLSIGQEVTISGSPDRNDPYSCYVGTIELADGNSIDRYGQLEADLAIGQGERPLRLANGEPNISGDWAQEQLVMTDPRGQRGTLVPLSQAANFGDGGVPEGQNAIPGARGTARAEQQANPNPPDGEAAPPPRPRFGGRTPRGLSEAGQAALAARETGDRFSQSCVFSSILSEWGGEPINRVTQRGDTIQIQYGRLGIDRTVYMSMTEHPADIEPSLAGHSIGHWEDDVLIIDTIGFEPGMLNRQLIHSAELHVVEEFWFDAETSQLRRSYTAEDALYFTEPTTGMNALDISNVPYAPELCDDLTLDDDAELGLR